MPASTLVHRTAALAATVLLASAIPGLAAADTPSDERRTEATCGGRGTLVLHRFTLPRRWANPKDAELSCVYKRRKVTVTVAWYRGAGSAEAMARRLERADNKPGYRQIRWDTDGPTFGSPEYTTRMFEYSYRGRDDRRHRVRMFGDRYTFLRVSAPSRRWEAASRAAKSARTTMGRIFAP
jgi:hypothetical protein